MVRENRIKDYVFPAESLTGNATTGRFDVYSDHVVNGKLQAVYWKAGNISKTGSIQVMVSGMGNESTILTMTSGTATGHNLEEDWVVFPRATTVTTSAIPTSGGGYIDYAEIWLNSIIRIIGSGVGTGSVASGLTLVYI
jgi:hypothetical protein